MWDFCWAITSGELIYSLHYRSDIAARPAAKPAFLPVRVLLRIAVVMLGLGAVRPLAAQRPTMQVNGFGHMEFASVRRDSTDAYFSMGEHSLFAVATLSDRVSFLGEAVVRPVKDSPTGFAAGLERALVRFTLRNNHALIAGKVHTPVNYWNDVYHHGRVFFPVIDRPFAFSHLVPLHTLGVQLQGQNLGHLRFGYDAMVGNGIASSDTYQGGVSPAAMIAVHAKPVDGLRVGVSLYHDHMSANGYGAHSGHGGAHQQSPQAYRGPVDFTLASASIAWFGQRTEFLHELSVNRNRTDSLGAAVNSSAFVYVGARVKESAVAYVFGDQLRGALNDLHVLPMEKWKVGGGVRYELGATVHVKAQVEYMRERLSHAAAGHSMPGGDPFMPWTRALGLRLQLAYGL